MEPPVSNCERRGRKRRRKFEKNALDVEEPGRQPKKRAIMEIRGLRLVGRYVLKEFDENGVFLGKISSYDSGLYRVDYEDGDCEDLDSAEVCQFLIVDEYFDHELRERRKKLDKCLEKNRAKADLKKKVDAIANVNRVELLAPAREDGSGGASADDADSCSDSSECAHDWDLQSQTEAATVPPPELPPSSGTIGLPEDCVPYLFSVYGFLRSFSVTIYLSPFTLDDLVGCLNCTVPNMLLDAIHVALLRIVRRRLEALSSDGSELAVKCLRCIDWTLLDVLTWPVYIVHYFSMMTYINGPEWKDFCSDVLDKDYCALAVGIKLKVLQILCDDALDTAEVRAEIDLREGSEVGLGFDEDPDFAHENGARVHQKYPRLPSSKDREAKVISADPSSKVHGGNDQNTSAADDVDRNSDECRLCGMDGMLLCCDGCPSAYHSRCIGVSKVFIPDGPWFCPECTVNRLGPPITVGTSLKGAEVFGSDSSGQVFMGTCNHLVVLNVLSDTAVPFARYYNRSNIPELLRALNVKAHHQVLYSGMCQKILKYWEFPPEFLPPLEAEARIDLGHPKEDVAVPITLCPAENGRMEDIGKESMVDNMLGPGYENHLRESGCDKIPMSNLPKQTDLTSVSTNCNAALRENFPYVANCGISGNATSDSSMFSTSISQSDVLSSSTHRAVTGGSSLKENDLSTSRQTNNSFGGNKRGLLLRIKLPCKKEGSSGLGTNGKNSLIGSSFKPHTYINHYVHGEFAAAAAAYLAVFSSEENRASETHVLDNPRKAIAASISLQTKAFSSAAVRFFWPSTEKKLFEVPRERCGWCLSCQGASASKKACLLNAAALNATRVETKIISGLRLSQNVESSSLYSIAMYTLYLEESLRGLVLGPFQSAIYRSKWRKKVELSTSCSEIKASLLELEGSLRTISLSGDWTKLVDDCSFNPSIILTTVAGSTQKRGGPGRPSRKHSCTAEVTPDDSGENSKDFIWWRGRKQSKLIFQRGILPHAMLKKAARRGGKRKIIGLHYADSSDIPKRSRQLVWRAAVERSKNASHLALQVRYLDHHIRWSDLVRPEQNPQDPKGLEIESSAFRNAFICNKRVAENKVMYCVVFGHQRHLPSRLMKSIIEKEETEDGKEKYWFLETRIPLYLTREYEQQQQTENAFSPSDNRLLYSLSSLQKKQLKDSRKDIFSYLVRKRDNMGVCCFCASCQQDVLLKITVKCNACEGYCHKECTMSSTVQENEDIEYIITCKRCVHAKIVAQNKNVESPTSPLALQGQEYQNGLSAAKSAKKKHSGKHLPVGASGSISNVRGLSVVKSGKKKHKGKQKLPVGTPESVTGVHDQSVSRKGKKTQDGEKFVHESSSGRVHPSADSSLNSNKKKKLCSLGLIWKKNKKNEPEESGIEFRRNNILLKGNPDNRDVSEVQCRSCGQKEYDPRFMYIHCEKCKFWFHSMVVELEESKLPDLVGFKCCKCRRIRIPKCPLLEETDGGDKGVESFSGYMSEQAESSIPTTPMTPTEDDVYIELDDPLLSSVKVEDIPDLAPDVNLEWNAPSMLGPQKLPVRRQNMKHEKDLDGLAGSNMHEAEPYLDVDSKDFSDPIGNLLLSPHAEWDACTGADDGMQFDYDQFNYEVNDFEPQTYFSFTELLASDDCSQPVAVASESIPDVWEDFGGEASRINYLDECEVKVDQPSNNQMEAIVSDVPAFNIQPCQICTNTEPAPELLCQNCGIYLHGHCSPWEELPQEGGWRCGNCREWR